jgi:hypothetical protein
MGLVAGLLGGGGGGGGSSARADSTSGGTIDMGGGDTYAMPTPTPLASSTGTILLIGAAVVATALVAFLIWRK